MLLRLVNLYLAGGLRVLGLRMLNDRGDTMLCTDLDQAPWVGRPRLRARPQLEPLLWRLPFWMRPTLMTIDEMTILVLVTTLVRFGLVLSPPPFQSF